MDVITRRAALVALLYSAVATAHDHDMSKIQEGSSVSEDPIVCLTKEEIRVGKG